MPDQVPPQVVAERYERLAALVAEVALRENEKLVGTQVEVLVAEGEGRKDSATHRMSGRARDNRLVHFTPPSADASPGGDPVASTAPRPGDVITTLVTSASPHYLIADGAPVGVRRTAGGDAWAARQRDGARSAEPDGVRGHQAGQAAGGGDAVLLGMPAIRALT
jgi:tRNA-2-methylthio-N6-dimethylallyladenosine synthase